MVLKPKFKARLLFINCSLAFLFSGCAVATLRPVQEMSNADAALKAARDVNADSLTPEVYRTAAENYFKAKREYKLKNFDAAKRFAIRSTRLAERAEFEAVRQGGATPEIEGLRGNSEGGSVDIDSNFRKLREQSEPQLPQEKPKADAGKPPSEPPAPGLDYNEYLKQQQQAQPEPEKPKADAEKKSEGDKDKAPKGLGGPSGPAGPFESARPQSSTGALPAPLPGMLSPSNNRNPFESNPFKNGQESGTGTTPSQVSNERYLLYGGGPALYPGPDIPGLKQEGLLNLVPPSADGSPSDHRPRAMDEGAKPLTEGLPAMNSDPVAPFSPEPFDTLHSGPE